MRSHVSVLVSLGFLVVFSSLEKATAQHAFAHTVTVDLSGNGDKPSIQQGIDQCETLGAPCTVLIYPGFYELDGMTGKELIHLDGDQEGIDLIGLDREAVIIQVEDGTSGSGIEITSGTETARDNHIRNLTVRTYDGHGIKIVKGTAVPTGITIENVTVQAAGTGKDGINAGMTENLTIRNCRITTAVSHGIKAVDPTDLLITDSAITGASSGHGVFLDADTGKPT